MSQDRCQGEGCPAVATKYDVDGHYCQEHRRILDAQAQSRNGNGTAPEAPAPPPWMHDFVPASCIFDCQGPDCDQSARAYWQNNVGFVAPGWQALDQKPYCSWLCIARYAALRAQDQIETVHAEAKDLAPPGKRSRHN